MQTRLTAFLPCTPRQVHCAKHTQAAVCSQIRASASSARSKPKPKQNPASKPKRPRAKKASKGELSNVGTLRPLINWYPGHIAKAERALQNSVKAVDVVIEVRDSRAPISTAHPSVPTWIGTRAHVVALSKADLCADVARRDWKHHLVSKGVTARFVDARRGRGVAELKKLAVAAGDGINEKRKARGLLPRPVRCLVAGYPNVGKSALINRLVGKRAAKSANKPGVTRGFQWIRIANDIELLDMPGIIPMRLGDQTTALRLAMCDDIGHGAYDPQIVAAKMIDELKRVASEEPEGYYDLAPLENRFKVSTKDISGEEFLFRAADVCHNGDIQRTAVRLFTEFRAGDLGLVALEPPPLDNMQNE